MYFRRALRPVQDRWSQDADAGAASGICHPSMADFSLVFISIRAWDIDHIFFLTSGSFNSLFHPFHPSRIRVSQHVPSNEWMRVRSGCFPEGLRAEGRTDQVTET